MGWRSVAERGKTGDHGQDGQPGPRGEAGRSLTRWQVLSLFFLVVAIGIIGATHLSWQQHAIDKNTQAIAAAQYQRCLDGNRILSRFNQQQEHLAAVEESLYRDPDASPAGKRAAKNRIDIYKAGMIVPLPNCAR